MDVLALTRQLVDIESVTGNEAPVGEFLMHHLTKQGFRAAKLPVESGRFNVYAHAGRPPELILSTHMDTVPPFFASSEDEANIYGRGACDAKGIIAAQIAAAERLRGESVAVGLLFTAGEERDSIGAKAANSHAPGSRFLVNGEPTDNRLAVATKGAMHVEIVATGKLAHSAYPELGESAVERLLDALARVRTLKLPHDPEFGPATMNIGVLSGGRAPNVIADDARASLLFRTVGPTAQLKRQIGEAVGTLARVEFGAESPFVKLRTVNGLPTMVASFSTDIPHLSKWGEPLLLGPGSIHVAHTEREHVSKRELYEAVELYCILAHKLLA